MKQKFDIKGMTCASCQLTVEKSVKKLGADNVNVSLLTNTMEVESNLSESEIINAVKDAGYEAISRNSISTKSNAKRDPKEILNEEEKSLKQKLIVSLPIMIILMYVAMGDMLGLPYPSWLMHHEGAGLYSFFQIILTIPVLFVNISYFKNGFRALFKGHPNMDTLVAIGSFSAVVYGLFATGMINYALGVNNHDMVMEYRHDLYFETASMILTLISLGKYLEVRSKKRTTDSINRLIDLQPDTVRVIRNGIEEVINVEDVVIGDIIKVVPGDRIAVDGEIIEGSSSVDTSAVTGESMPVDVKVGDNIISGSVNSTGTFKMKATSVGDDTTINKIITLMEEASATKAPIAQMADKISGIFVPIVLGISALAFIYWLAVGSGFTFAFSIAIAILVISCPCALGLATPVAVMVATGKAADNGILIKNAESLEKLHSVDTIVFDKTGTITKGKPVLTDLITINGFSPTKALEIASALENDSQHPLALAIINHAKDKNINIKSASEFDSITGKGVKAFFLNEKYYLGNKKLMDDISVFENEVLEISDRLSNEGKTTVYLSNEDKIIAIFAISDAIKETSLNALENIRNLGIKTVMLTGDNKITANAIAKRVGIDEVHGELMPEDKDRIVQKYQANGDIVAMVGDGINDAPALIRSDIGIGIADGTDIAIESADLVLMKSNLEDIFGAIKLSEATIKNIKQNLFWAFFYNVIAIPVAMGVFYNAFGLKLNPMIGALAMSMSSIFVVTNSLRLKRFKINYTKANAEQTLSNEVVYDNIDLSEIKKGDTKMKKRVLGIEGMSCNHCKMSVEKELGKLAKDVTVSLEDKNAVVVTEENITDDQLINAVTEAGYKVVSVE